ncbi:MAG: protein translocase subunit SecD, partial [Novosphingobium sp.]|nr:protein translocase subunit SecD [Novosphingobium sp.]
MLDFPRWKQLWFWAITLVACLAALPSIFSVAGLPWPAMLPAPKVNLGLDLAGGSHILLEANTAQVAGQRLETMADEVRNALKRASKPVQVGDISIQGGKVSFMVQDPSQVDAAREAVLPLTNGAGLSGKRDWSIDIVNGNTVVLTQSPEGLDNAVVQAMDTATEVVRRRIDALGTREPTIIRQGANRIVVQVPGLKDPTALKNLLGQTAKLEFKMVDTTAS